MEIFMTLCDIFVIKYPKCHNIWFLNSDLQLPAEYANDQHGAHNTLEGTGTDK